MKKIKNIKKKDLSNNNPNPEEEKEEDAMTPIFLQSSLLVTISTSHIELQVGLFWSTTILGQI